MPGKNAFYAQSGGVTAVINATACGVIEKARDTISTILEDPLAFAKSSGLL